VPVLTNVSNASNNSFSRLHLLNMVLLARLDMSVSRCLSDQILITTILVLAACSVSPRGNRPVYISGLLVDSKRAGASL
jgi:hypothetical protein